MIKYSEDREEFTVSLQSLFVVCELFVFGLYLLFSNSLIVIMDMPKKYMFLMFMDIFVVTAFQFWSARQRVNFEYKKLVIITAINAILKPSLGIIAILNCPNRIDARIITMVIADVIVFGQFSVKILIGKKSNHHITKYWKYALTYNLPLVPHYLSQIVLNQSDRIMINSLVGSGEAGIYSLAYSAAAILTIVNQSVLNSFNPWLYQKIKDKKYQNIGSVSISLLIIIGMQSCRKLKFTI